jgi:diguanylate cyclase (GGDEF)-like protein
MLDLDHFKQVNDDHGHAAGDVVLRHFAERVQDSLRKTDQAGRLGGEEFAILLFGTDHASATEFAERLRDQVAADEAEHDSVKLRVTVSIGVTQLWESDASTDETLARADAALYRAKANGRNRVESAY